MWGSISHVGTTGTLRLYNDVMINYTFRTPILYLVCLFNASKRQCKLFDTFSRIVNEVTSFYISDLLLFCCVRTPILPSSKHVLSGMLSTHSDRNDVTVIYTLSKSSSWLPSCYSLLGPFTIGSRRRIAYNTNID